MKADTSLPQKANYGIDAPDVVIRFFIIGIIGIILFISSPWLLQLLPRGLAIAIVNTGFWAGLSFLITALAMLWGSKFGKLGLRDRILGGINWQGVERVLDVGCGHGLMLIGAAKRLTIGKAIGVDIWQQADQAGNSPVATIANATIEGVADRIQLMNGDARKLPFENGSFDLILSSWALHNIYNATERKLALQEIVRVLKPGGRLAIVDISHTAEYVDVLRECGMSEVKRSMPSLIFVIPSYLVSAIKLR
jgi:SAM-dependent methyltransferase